eukprot:Gb_13872 [translate_table: standard]
MWLKSLRACPLVYGKDDDYIPPLVASVVEFSKEVAAFRDKTIQKGPGQCTDLDLGVELMHQCRADLEKIQSKREQLVLAQKLFDLPVTPYPMLVEVETALKNYSAIYTVYDDFRDAVKKSSTTLWVELDIHKIISTTEEFNIRMKRLRNLKTELPYINLEAKIKGFQESLPLIQVF